MLHQIQGVLCVEGTQTGDGRIMQEGALTWADLPLPFACLTGDQHARGESEQVGTVETIARAGTLVGFTGLIDDQIEQGAEMIRQMQAGSAPLGARYGVSIDPDDWEVELVDTTGDSAVLMLASGHGRFPARHLSTLTAAAGDPDPGGTVIMDDSADALIERYTRLRIRGATACSVAAFDGAYVELVTAAPESNGAAVTVTVQPAEAGTLDFAAHGPFSGMHTHFHSTFGQQGADQTHEHSHSHSNDAVHDHQHATTASGEPCDDCGDESLTAAGGPLLPPAEWFANPSFSVGDGRLVRQPSGQYACPLTVTPEGRVFGHMAPDGQCHTGFVDRCVTAPHSPSGYSYFMTGSVPTAEGELVRVGQLTMGAGHPDESPRRPLNWRAAKAHYDGGPGAVQMADVTVGEDEFGIWFAGTLRPDVADIQVRAFQACGVSGDWREVVRGQGLDLIACAAGVVSPAFPVAGLAASAVLSDDLLALIGPPIAAVPTLHLDEGRPVALVASGLVRQPAPWERALGEQAQRIEALESRLGRAETVTMALRGPAAEHWMAAAGVSSGTGVAADVN